MLYKKNISVQLVNPFLRLLTTAKKIPMGGDGFGSISMTCWTVTDLRGGDGGTHLDQRRHAEVVPQCWQLIESQLYGLYLVFHLLQTFAVNPPALTLLDSRVSYLGACKQHEPLVGWKEAL